MKLIINTIGHFKNLIILLAILIEIGWLGLTIKNNLDSNTVQTEAISVLAKSTILESKDLPVFKKMQQQKISTFGLAAEIFSLSKKIILAVGSIIIFWMSMEKSIRIYQYKNLSI